MASHRICVTLELSPKVEDELDRIIQRLRLQFAIEGAKFSYDEVKDMLLRCLVESSIGEDKEIIADLYGWCYDRVFNKMLEELPRWTAWKKWLGGW